MQTLNPDTAVIPAEIMREAYRLSATIDRQPTALFERSGGRT
ncbi:hypothetical protein [Phyllobacterium leguminum]|uniref:Uncharacterized protein n=1 Tax=Phyllobacterium leguminum TaxID=314237 RepID=A0A318T5Y2_9HYPH|nr:hypothetical protein [Phyllobacterium leguminum]PYE89647.1 hypothetical protein C7477_103155 [Phyllobacterium leguminum]